MNVFPFTLSKRDGDRLFQQYVMEHREHLAEKYGEYCIVGVGPARKRWSYYEVDVEVLSEYVVMFTTYDMADAFYGGRGAQQDVIPHTYQSGAHLKAAVAERKQAVARQTYAARQEEAARAAFEAGVAAVHKELFGDPACISHD